MAKSEDDDSFFITVNGPSVRGLKDVSERRRIRSRLMHNHLSRNKESPEAAKSPPQAETSVTVTSHQFTRFRLGPVSHKRKQPRAKTALSRPLRPHAAETKAESDDQIIAHENSSPDQNWSTYNPLELDISRLCLPIDEVPGINSLFDYFISRFCGDWLPYAFSDPALLYMTLSYIALHRALFTQYKNLRCYYYHRGKAMELVSGRLGKAEGLSDATLSAVAMLAATEATVRSNKDIQYVRAHMDGLWRMVMLRGGLAAIHITEVFRPTLVWAKFCDTVFAETSDEFWGDFDLSHNDLKARLVGRQFVPLACTKSERIVSGELDGVFDDLRQLVSERELILEGSEDFAVMPPLSAGNHGFHLALRDGALLFSLIALREVPVTSRAFEIVTERLRNNLSLTMIAEPNIMNEYPDLYLWVMWIGWLSTGEEKRTWFMEHLVCAAKTLKLYNEEDLKTSLRKVVWLNKSCGPPLHDCWQSIGQLTTYPT